MHQFLSLSEQLTSQHSYGGGSISYFLILGLGDVDEDLGGRVINMHGAEDGGSVVGDVDVFALGSCGDGD